MENEPETRLKLKIQKFAYLGYGLAKSEGLTVFVPGGIPGDIVEVEITSIKKKYVFAKIINILKASPFRKQQVPCPQFWECGGCDYLHMDYKNELYFKEEVIKEQIKHNFRNLPKFMPIIPSKTENYRTKVELKFDKNKKKFGFYAKHTNKVIPIPEGNNFCLIQPKNNWNIIDYVLNNLKNEFINKLDGLTIRHSFSYDETLLLFQGSFHPDDEPIPIIEKDLEKYKICSINTINNKGVISNLYGMPYYKDKFLDYEYIIGTVSFFQTNAYIFTEMLKILKDMLHTTRDDIVLDLYCGIGAFTFLLAENSHHVYAIESDENAILLARENMQINNINNITFISGKIRKKLPKLKFNKKVSLAIVDPPRKGMHYLALNSLIKLAPESIVYISCHLPTFIRDAKILSANGYKFLFLYPLDMFPHTFHIEIMAYFTK